MRKHLQFLDPPHHGFVPKGDIQMINHTEHIRGSSRVSHEKYDLLDEMGTRALFVSKAIGPTIRIWVVYDCFTNIDFQGKPMDQPLIFGMFGW